MSRRAPRSRNNRKITRLLTCFLAVTAVVAGTVLPAGAASAAAPATTVASNAVSQAVGDPAASGIVKSTLVGFTPGNIISDAVFTNKSTMTEAQIQAFFNSKVSRCLGGTDENGKPIVCLKDFKITSVTRPADQYCSGYTGAANESAARIIYRVSQACNINPQVLIVMLQKEQGLITHTWPSAWRYNIALGQGCPDTAPCDPNYIGFFHQIYGAARQMQIYMEGRWFQWYAPGKTWNILYNPNANCGSSPVYVANKATSALYYYTPYQPNAAALRAGYGTGDGCSAYGNRNFYNYFTDWFGSTQGIKYPDGPIVNVGKDIYAISNGTAYHITAEVWPEYKAAYGNPEATVGAHIASLGQGGAASLFLRDRSTGTVAYLNGGKMHRFASCDLVAQWRGSCSSLTTFDSDDFQRPGSGPEMTTRANVRGDTRIFSIEGKDLVPYQNAAAMSAWGQNASLYAATMPAAHAAQYPAARTRFVPGQLITVAGSDRVFLPSSDGQLIYVPVFANVTSMGLSTSVLKAVPAQWIAQHPGRSNLGRYIVCNGATYFTSGGLLYRSPSSGGFVTVAPDSRTCAKLKVGDDAAGPLFVRSTADAAVFYADGGTFRHVTNQASLAALRGPGATRLVPMSPADLASLPKGPPLRTDIGLVTTAGDGRVYLADAGRLIYLSSWATADDLGLPRAAVTISDAGAASMPRAGTVTNVVSCNSIVYTARAGVYTKIADTSGLTPMVLSADNCVALGIR
ncbi:hypothetical protein ACFY9N_05950 [Microbacterium sp. NPDC008134]|uniref:hypothetical protein n=1 Tax=Microbacterium sp. NPDC008134 TaxID=3364183 RepID=UPI0036EA9C0D